MNEFHPTKFLGNDSEGKMKRENEIRDPALKLRGGGILGAQLPTQQPLGAAGSAGKGRIFNS